MFRGRRLLIATRHQKEKVMAPILEKELGVRCFVLEDLDTDKLGTFTGEFERIADPVTTARAKCEMALQLTDCDLAVGSEGSFGPHPGIFFVPADDEMMIFIDKKNQLEIVVREISTETNFNASLISTKEELEKFATHAGFPAHGLILRKSQNDFASLVKGIRNAAQLNNTFAEIIERYGEAYVETDMRAMHNPLRMKMIERTTLKLADRIKSRCRVCQMPGFGVTEAVPGLPCESCNFPTRSTLIYICTCQKCGYTEEKKYPDGKQHENPMYCDICNP